jgi:FKBP-type peptidyl-prolyl cis-trans isomerase
MRRAHALLVVPLLAVAAIAGCGSSSHPSSATSSDANKAVRVTGAFGAAPKVTIPAEEASASLYTKTVIQGSGAPLTKTESAVSNFALYDWSGKTNKLIGSTFSSRTPTLFGSQIFQAIPGLKNALIGQKAGSRVLAVIPPKDGFGSQGNSQLGVGGSDTMVFVVDLIEEFSNTAAANGAHVSNGGGSLPTVSFPAQGKAPTVKIPSGVKPPKKLTVTTLIKGTGPKLTKGQTVVVQYVGVNWRTKQVFDSSWSRTAPFSFTLDANPEDIIPGWDTGLTGKAVGSRVLLVIPPADGYGKTGNSQAGIEGTDTLVFVVDIVGAVNP